jgi:hypothetical protein
VLDAFAIDKTECLVKRTSVRERRFEEAAV